MYLTPILLALSGGLDSMVMLHRMLIEYEPEHLAVAHCNFQLRGEESDADEKFLATTCQELGLRFHAKRMNTEVYAAGHRIGIQEAARELRYQYFESLMQQYGYVCVATAHHRDDSIETFFINLLRGTGPEGLTGIQDDRQRKIIRPLLDMDRAEILAYAERHGVDWREDSSNSSLKYLRNHVRHELIPLMRDMRPGFEKAIHRNMAIQKGLAEMLQSQAVDYRATQFIQQAGYISITLDARVGEALILGRLLADYGFNYTQITDVLSSAESGAQVRSASHTLTYHRQELQLSERSPIATGPWHIQEDLKCAHLPFELHIELLDSVPARLDQGLHTALIDTDRLKFPLCVRLWEAGDRLQPLGMQGYKKLSDMLNDIGLSIEEKKKVYVLVSGDDIIWVIGHRIDDRYKVRPNSKALLKVYI